jgi:type IV pilus assembly protein PilM
VIKEALFYSPKPLFGFDIGHGSVKLIHVDRKKKIPEVIGYGAASFDPMAIKDGEIIDFEAVAKATHSIFKENLQGKILSSHVAASLPVTHTYNRVISLPKMEKKNLAEAVRFEAEQYIPIPVDQLYLDYQIIEEANNTYELLLSAAPIRVVDSYVKLFSLLGVTVTAFEPSILSVARLVKLTERTDIPTLVIDLGSITTDLIIYDSNFRVTGTVSFGGYVMTERIAAALRLTHDQAHIIKTKYGLEKSKKQKEITEALSQPLLQLLNEVKKIVRYYEDRDQKAEEEKEPRKVGQIVILGGGANLPGLSGYMTNYLRIPTRLCDPWGRMSFSKIPRPHHSQNTMYATAAGLSMINPKELFRD